MPYSRSVSEALEKPCSPSEHPRTGPTLWGPGDGQRTGRGPGPSCTFSAFRLNNWQYYFFIYFNFKDASLLPPLSPEEKQGFRRRLGPPGFRPSWALPAAPPPPPFPSLPFPSPPLRCPPSAVAQPGAVPVRAASGASAALGVCGSAVEPAEAAGRGGEASTMEEAAPSLRRPR